MITRTLRISAQLFHFSKKKNKVMHLVSSSCIHLCPAKISIFLVTQNRSHQLNSLHSPNLNLFDNIVVNCRCFLLVRKQKNFSRGLIILQKVVQFCVNDDNPASEIGFISAQKHLRLFRPYTHPYKRVNQ